ncbi:GDP-mannose 4,6-dehydratase [Candidatus Magnetobacterium bavaricum]|uniref:GDP-mannose 4,6-dehydratase n=1 Tax=Candidatus Magnetobacterium bavaricum TaxID=29290 RepID=A0A0F3GWW9_9BACT|nr:GDP-mannose 4,6-dehydratase [Candidatus Magnetobacterium bavaricum]
MRLAWEGVGINEQGIDRNTGKVIVEIDPRFFRPVDVDHLIGNASKAKEKIKWQPKLKFKELVELMTQTDYDREAALSKNNPPVNDSPDI